MSIKEKKFPRKDGTLTFYEFQPDSHEQDAAPVNALRSTEDINGGFVTLFWQGRSDVPSIINFLELNIPLSGPSASFFATIFEDGVTSEIEDIHVEDFPEFQKGIPADARMIKLERRTLDEKPPGAAADFMIKARVDQSASHKGAVEPDVCIYGRIDQIASLAEPLADFIEATHRRPTSRALALQDVHSLLAHLKAA